MCVHDRHGVYVFLYNHNHRVVGIGFFSDDNHWCYAVFDRSMAISAISADALINRGLPQ